jgi:hypothetical protein
LHLCLATDQRLHHITEKQVEKQDRKRSATGMPLIAAESMDFLDVGDINAHIVSKPLPRCGL